MVWKYDCRESHILKRLKNSGSSSHLQASISLLPPNAWSGTHYAHSTCKPSSSTSWQSLSVLAIYFLKFSTYCFLTHFRRRTPCSSIFFMNFDLFVCISVSNSWKNTSYHTSPSPPRYLNCAAILSCTASSCGQGCALKLSTLQSRSRK